MKNMTSRMAMLIALAPLASPASASDIYKYRMPDGTFLYTDAVAVKGTLKEVIVPAPPTPPQVVLALNAKLKRDTVRANRYAEQRRMSQDAIDLEIRSAALALAEARAAMIAGIEPEGGERLGTVSGHTRLGPDYWARQRDLQESVLESRERLDDAYVAQTTIK